MTQSLYYASAIALALSQAPQLKAQTQPTIYGSVVFGHGWEDMGGNAPYGIYSVQANDAGTLKSVKLDSKLTAFGGGVYVDGRYYLVDYSPYNYDGTVSFRTYDVEAGWKLIDEKRISTYTSVASDLAYDPTADLIYGCFREGPTSSSYFLGTLNPVTGLASRIASLKEELIAMAATRDGQLYGVGSYGMLYSIDKSSGTLKEIGQTGKTVKYAQSATIDYPSGRMLWAMTPHYTDENPEICEVNLADGTTTTLTTIPDRYQFTGIYTTGTYASSNAPARPANIKANFDKGSLTGSITLDMPNTTTGGAALAASAQLGYRLYADGQAISEGNGKAGTTASCNATLSRGMHHIKATAYNTAGRSQMAYYDFWAGTDYVNATNPKATKAVDGTVNVTWTAPSAGNHGGYFDPQDVSYRVTRQPGSTVVYTGKATSFADTGAKNLQAGRYRYDIEAQTGGEYGDAVSSPVIQIGTSLQPPYTQGFDDEVSASTMTIDDANGDGETWQFFGDCFICGVSETGDDDDDWLITPVFDLSADSVYEVSVDAKAEESYKELMSIYAGTAAKGSSMTQVVTPTTEVANTEYRTISGEFVPAHNGACHIGIHATSKNADGSYLYVDNLSVRTVGSVLAPSEPTNGSATAQGSERKVLIAFSAPTTDMRGNSLSGTIRRITVTRTNDNTVVKTLDNVTPGQALELTDTPLADGMTYYDIKAANDHGNGRSLKLSAYVGYDTPAAVTGVRFSATDDGKTSVEWTAPAKGTHGGTVNAAELKYTIGNVGGSSLRSTVTTQTSFAEQLDMDGGKQRLAWYTITPETTLGQGTEVSTDTLFVGNPYTLPYAESFAKRSLQCGPWLAPESELARWDIMQYGSYADAADQDNGLIAFSTITQGAEASFVGPKISLAGTTQPRLTFYVWNMKSETHWLNVQYKTPDGSIHTIDRFVPNNAEGDGINGEWQKRTYSLGALDGYDYIQLVFTGEGGDTEDLSAIKPLYVDNITIDDPLAHNLTAGELSAVIDRVAVGDDLSLVLSVKNSGEDDATDFDVLLYREDMLVGKTHVDNIAAGKTAEVELTDAPNSDAKMASLYHAVISWDSDQDSSDNTSASVPVTILPGKPYISRARAEASADQQRVTLTWSEPDGITDGTTAATVCEDFEQYVPFTIRHFGEWTLEDADGHSTLGIQDGSGNFVQYDNVEAPMAFQIFNPQAAGISTTLYPTHSGRQVAAAFSSGRYTANDDWLISPEVDGQQTISFWACSPDSRYYGTQEQMEVLYSTESTDISSFKKIGSTLNIPGQWTEYTAELPAGARHFALRCTSMDQYILFVDDITYRKAARNFRLLGYRIYRNGSLLTPQPVKQTSYEADYAPDRNDTYTVCALYNTGESRQAIASWDGTAAIGGPVTDTDKNSGSTEIYDITGQRIGNTQHLSRGVYIVKQNGKTRKIQVK